MISNQSHYGLGCGNSQFDQQPNPFDQQPNPFDQQLKLLFLSVHETTDYAFAAVKEDGSVITWGDEDSGGDSSSVAGQLKR